MTRTLRAKRPKFWGSSRGKVRDGADQFVSRQCRHNGPCPYCENGRSHKHKRRAPIEETP